MNKKTFWIVFVFGFLFVQSVVASGGSDGYSGSRGTIQEFKRRFTEIRNDNEFTGTSNFPRDFYFGSYARSQNSLQDFKRRFTEIRNDNEFTGTSNFPRDFYF